MDKIGMFWKQILNFKICPIITPFPLSVTETGLKQLQTRSLPKFFQRDEDLDPDLELFSV